MTPPLAATATATAAAAAAAVGGAATSSLSRSVLGIIPARLKNSRFPNKILTGLRGRPLIQHTIENFSRASCLSRVIVSCDHQSVADAARQVADQLREKHVASTSSSSSSARSHVEVEVRLVEDSPRNPLERTFDVVRSLAPEQLSEWAPSGLVVHLHADEPVVSPQHIDQLVQRMRTEEKVPFGTLVAKCHREQEVLSTDTVKVVVNQLRRAMYFSRGIIPHNREGGVDLDGLGSDLYYRHIGAFATRLPFLMETYQKMVPTPLEQHEKLEMLRILEFGFPVACEVVESSYPAVNTPEDLYRIDLILKSTPSHKTEDADPSTEGADAQKQQEASSSSSSSAGSTASGTITHTPQ